jgi:hypothetical protein
VAPLPFKRYPDGLLKVGGATTEHLDESARTISIHATQANPSWPKTPGRPVEERARGSHTETIQ